MQLFDTTMRVVSQGGTRKGSMAAYLPIDHPDIAEFLRIKDASNPIQDLSFGITVTDQWMDDMISGDTSKQEVWAKILVSRKEKGYPYILFSDTINNNTVDVYKDKGIKIVASNLCVTGDQRVPTQYGLLTAKQLQELAEPLTLTDNEKLVSSSPMRLIETDADVFKITLENGMSHSITSYHKVKTRDGNKSCSELVIGDSVAVQTNKGIFGNRNAPREAFLLGLYQSDGTQHKDDIMLDIWEKDFDLIPEIEQSFADLHNECGANTYDITSNGVTRTRSRTPATFHDCVVTTGTVKKKRLSSRTLKKCFSFEKGYVPYWIWEADEKTVWQYVRGLLYADGSVVKSTSKGNPIQIAYYDANKEFLQELQILFANLGLQTSFRILREAGQSLLPDGKGSTKYYDTKACYRLIISNKTDALEIERNTGFLSRKGIALEDRQYRDNSKKFYKIKSIEHTGKEDVYCCTVESEEHLWVCNGVVTHNCSEIMLPSSPTESFVCCLTGLNISKYDEWKDTDIVRTTVFLLDAVMSDFIERTEHLPGFERARNFAVNHRALGLGAVGWHTYLQTKMIPFDSYLASSLTESIFKSIKNKAYEASQELAGLYGEPPLLKGYGRRNSTLLAFAPNTTSGAIIRQISTGIEPIPSNYYVVNLAAGKFTRKNPELLKLLESKSQNTLETWSSILAEDGSVQHLDFLSQEEKDVFKTFREINQFELVRQAGKRQKYIDQGQSLNINVPPGTELRKINQLHIEAWKSGVKALYYQRSSSSSNNFTLDNICVSCDG